jgi:hypothetical protein
MRYLKIPYETIEITMEGESVDQVIRDIDSACSIYFAAIKDGKVK